MKPRYQSTHLGNCSVSVAKKGGRDARPEVMAEARGERKVGGERPACPSPCLGFKLESLPCQITESNIPTLQRVKPSPRERGRSLPSATVANGARQD